LHKPVINLCFLGVCCYFTLKEVGTYTLSILCTKTIEVSYCSISSVSLLFESNGSIEVLAAVSVDSDIDFFMDSVMTFRMQFLSFLSFSKSETELC